MNDRGEKTKGQPPPLAVGECVAWTRTTHGGESETSTWHVEPVSRCGTATGSWWLTLWSNVADPDWSTSASGLESKQHRAGTRTSMGPAMGPPSRRCGGRSTAAHLDRERVVYLCQLEFGRIEGNYEV